MKVNFVLPGLGDSGGIRVINKYTELLKAKGCEVNIYSSIVSSNLYRYHSNLKNLLHQLYCTLKTISVYLKKERPDYKWVWKINGKYLGVADATIATTWATAYEVVKLPPHCGKLVYFIQGYEIWDNEKLGKQSYLLPLEKIVISTWINQQLKIYLGIGPYPVVLNGIDPIYIQEIEKTENVPEVKCLMLYHTLSIKGVKEGIEAFNKAKESLSGITLSMFGIFDNPQIPSYIDYLYQPTKEQLLKLYQNSDIFIYPSLEDGWGLTPLEAMAAGCAVVANNTGFVLDLGRDEENMLICTPGDVQQMSECIIRLANDNELRKKIGNAGLETAKKCSWENSGDAIYKILSNNNNAIKKLKI